MTARASRGAATFASSAAPRPLVPMPAGTPETVRAVSIGLALLKAARVQSWDDLVATLRADNQSASRLDGIDLTANDLALLDAHLLDRHRTPACGVHLAAESWVPDERPLAHVLSWIVAVAGPGTWDTQCSCAWDRGRAGLV